MYLTNIRSWLYGVYDVGRVWNIGLEKRRSAASVGIGYKMALDSLYGSIEVVKPLTRPILLEEEDGNDMRVFVSFK